MRALLGLVGLLIVVIILWDIFETIVLPRRVTRRVRLTRVLYRSTWIPWSATARRIINNKRREKFLSYYGPLSLLMLLVVWAVSIVFAMAMIQWEIGSNVSALNNPSSFLQDLYFSGTTFFTLGLGDVMPIDRAARFATVVEASLGLGMLALVIGYFPVIYQAFSRREAYIAMLDARAGTPPTAGELLRRHREGQGMQALDQLLQDWERWSADLLESHLSYPVLCFFRSQHDNQSWLASLTTVLDTCSLVMVGIDGTPKWQAQLTFKIARHAVVDIAQIFNTSPLRKDGSRLTEDGLISLRTMLAGSDVALRDEPGDNATLAQLRSMYEPYLAVLSEYLMMPLPGWAPKSQVTDNWQTSAWEVSAPASEQPFRKCMLSGAPRHEKARTAVATPEASE
jgi:ion channel